MHDINEHLNNIEEVYSFWKVLAVSFFITSIVLAFGMLYYVYQARTIKECKTCSSLFTYQGS